MSGAFEVMVAKGSSRTLHFTFGYCFVNNWVRSTMSGNPDSNNPCIVTGCVPQFAAKLAGPLAAAVNEAACAPVWVTAIMVAANKPANAE
jgi:hypothetical protein